AVIEPDGSIRHPNDDQVRQMARERGWWNLFAEIERDAPGFGPPGAQIDRVPLVFEPEHPAACTEPPVLKLAEPQAEGLAVVLDGRAMPGCPDDPIRELTIAWGDGAVATDLPARHVYPQAGAYMIAIRVISAQGREATAQYPVKLQMPVAAPALPNLVAEIVKAPEKATCGQQLGDNVTVRVVNSGAADAGGFYLVLYLSEDEKITTKDYRLSAPWPDPRTPVLRTSPLSSQTYIEGLAAGHSLITTMRGANQIPTSLPEGTRTYWLGISVDETGAVREDNEADNTSPAWPITIGCLK
ncbi:MAG: hypothetical protein N2439_13290, partial [Anaerolineae bacterium]|nr:hypothetical protein [Anaerolineae bacterium]